MYLLVLSLLWLLFQNSATAQTHSSQRISAQNKTAIKYSEDVAYCIYLCEYCGKKNERLRTTYDRIYVKQLQSLKLFPSSSWASEARNLFEKQQESEYQILGTKSWPPLIPFSVSPLKEKNGLLVFLSSNKEITFKENPKNSNYILFYHGKVFIESSDLALEKVIKEPEITLSRNDGIRFFIAREVSGEQISALENIIKNFTDDKNSIIIPYEVTAEGIRYHSDIGLNNLMRALKQINQFVPNLSARLVRGTNDAIEITKAK